MQELITSDIGRAGERGEELRTHQTRSGLSSKHEK
jgi:hypothetical protein